MTGKSSLRGYTELFGLSLGVQLGQICGSEGENSRDSLVPIPFGQGKGQGLWLDVVIFGVGLNAKRMHERGCGPWISADTSCRKDTGPLGRLLL